MASQLLQQTDYQFEYGDILFFHGRGFIARAIRFFDPGRFNHVAIVLGTKFGRTLFLESSWGGVHASFLKESEHNYVVLRPEIDPRPVDELLSTVGKKYGYEHIFWLAMDKITFGLVAPLDERGHLICSQLANYAYNYRLGNERAVTPNSIYRRLHDGLRAIKL